MGENTPPLLSQRRFPRLWWWC